MIASPLHALIIACSIYLVSSERSYLRLSGSLTGDYGCIAGDFLDDSVTTLLTSGPFELLPTNETGCIPLNGKYTKKQVALLLRGSCTFYTKLNNALRAGAAGVVIALRNPGYVSTELPSSPNEVFHSHAYAGKGHSRWAGSGQL